MQRESGEKAPLVPSMSQFTVEDKTEDERLQCPGDGAQ
jgi:hypothetical protein